MRVAAVHLVRGAQRERRLVHGRALVVRLGRAHARAFGSGRAALATSEHLEGLHVHGAHDVRDRGAAAVEREVAQLGVGLGMGFRVRIRVEG